MTNNELSRRVLARLFEHQGRIRFKDLVAQLEVEERTVFKNLFFLEERGYLKLSTSYPSDAVYPLIHLVRLRETGEQLAQDPKKLDAAFPLSEGHAELTRHSPASSGPSPALTFAQALEAMSDRIRETLAGEERDAAIERIESLLALPVAAEPIQGKT